VFVRTINRCKSAAACTVNVAAGTYAIHGGRGPRIQVRDLSQVSIIGVTGQTILSVDGIGGAFQFTNCSDLLIAGLTLDQPRAPFTLGTVAMINGSAVTMSVDLSVYPASGDAWLNQAQGTMAFDVSAGRPEVNALDSYTAAPLTWDAAGAQVTGNYPAAFASQMRVGASYILRHQIYALNAISFNGLLRPTFRELDILSTPGMGIVGQNARDASFSNVRVRKAHGRHMSITADGMHLMNTQGFIVIENCIFEGQGDDGINIPTVYNSVLQKLSPHSVAMGGRNSNTKVVAPSMAVGDAVEFRSRSSFAAYFSTRVAAIDAATHAVSFADPLPARFARFDLVVSSTQQPDSILIRNNTFRNNRARGVLLKQRNALVVGNRFVGCSGPAVQADPDGCFWFEGDVVANWTVADNEISNNNYGPGRQAGDVWLSSCVPAWNADGTPAFQGAAPRGQQPHSSVTVRGNAFYQFSGQAAVSAQGVAGLQLRANSVTWAPSTQPAEATFVSPDCTGVVVAPDNRCSLDYGPALPCSHAP
jgi:hypothetical protein